MSGIDDTFLDSLTSIDEEIARLHDLLSQKEFVLDADKVELSDRPRKREIHDHSKLVTGNIAEEDDVSRTTKSPFDGWVDGILAGWPDGADQSVGLSIRLVNGDEIMFPQGGDDFSALNDFTGILPVTFPVIKNDKIKSLFKNNKSKSVPINSLPIFVEAKEGEIP